MGLDAILNELKYRGNRAFLSFRDLDGFFVDGYNHTFATIAGKRGDKESVKKVKKYVKSIEELKEFEIKDNNDLGFDDKVAAFEVVHLLAPVYFASDQAYTAFLKKNNKIKKGVEIKTPLPKIFFTGHYKRNLEKDLEGHVNGVFEIDSDLASALKLNKEFNEQYKEFGEKLAWSNKMGEALANYEGELFDKTNKALTKKDKEAGLDEKIELFKEKIIEVKKSLKKVGPSHIEYNHTYREFQVHFDSDIIESQKPLEERNIIKYKRSRTLEEINSDTTTFFDIEKFEFDTDAERVDLVVMYNMKNGEMTNKILLSRYECEGEILGFEIDYCKDAAELVKKASDFVKGEYNLWQEESQVLSAFYIPFDSVNMREEAKAKFNGLGEKIETQEFAVGARDSDPKKEVSTKFFEKIGVYGKNTEDPLDLSKVKFGHFPNQKLSMMSQEAEEGEEKIPLKYRNSREISVFLTTGKTEQFSEDTLQIIAQKLGAKEVDPTKFGKYEKEICNEIVNEYTVVDGLASFAYRNWKMYQEGLEDRIVIASELKLDPYRLIHDPNRVNDAQDLDYFKAVGVWRDDVYKKWQIMIKYEQKAMNKFREFNFKSIPKPGKRGSFKNVYKAYVPLTRFLEENVAKNFPAVKKIIEYNNQFKNDKLRQADIAHFEDAACKWIIQDYATCLLERDNMKNLLKKIKPHADELFMGHSFEDRFHQACWAVRNEMIDAGFVDRYKKANATQEILEETLEKVKPNYLESEKLNLGKFQSLFNQWAKVQSKERKVYGNYGVRAFFYPFSPDKIPSIEEALDKRESEVFRFIFENDMELMHVQGNYVYVRGNKENLYKKECPFFLVDKLDRVIITNNPSDSKNRDKNDVGNIAQKIYYEKHGFFEGIKIDESASHYLTRFEMKAYGDFIENVLEDEFEKAFSNFYDRLFELEAGAISNEELVWVSKEKQRYRAFEYGETVYFYTRDYFHTHERFENVEMLFDDDVGRGYVEEEIGSKKIDGKRMPKIEKVYIMDMEELRPDWEMYKNKRIIPRSRDLLEAFLGENYKRFFEEVIPKEAFGIIAEDIMVQ